MSVRVYGVCVGVSALVCVINVHCNPVVHCALLSSTTAIHSGIRRTLRPPFSAIHPSQSDFIGTLARHETRDSVNEHIRAPLLVMEVCVPGRQRGFLLRTARNAVTQV